MKKSLIFASIACAGAFALHAEYGQWFTAIGASASATNAMNESNGTWVFNVTNGTATVESNKLQFELDDGETIIFNADQAAAIDTNTVTRVTVKGVFTPVSVSDLPTDAEMNGRGAQVGFVVGSSTVESTTTYNYYVWTGVPAEPAGDKNWSLVGSPIAEANIANESTILIEFDYSHSVLASSPYNTVKFSTISSDGATTNQLGSTFTLTSNAGVAAHSVAGMTCYGSGTLASADGAVQIGVAKVDGVKYGSLQAAADATASATDKTIEVVREPHGADATATLPDGVAIYDPEQKAKDAAIAVAADATVTVKPTAAEIGNGASGPCSVPLNITLGSDSKVEIDLSGAPGKEVAGAVNVSGTTATFTTQTAKSVLTAATVGGKSLNSISSDSTKEETLRTLLNNYASAAYTRAYTNPADANAAIQSALETVPENQNGLALWQDYALGIQPTAPVKPVAAPVDTASDAVTLSIPSLVGATQSGDFTIKYRVDKGSTTGTAYELTGGAVSVPLPASAGGERHSVKIVFE